MTPEQLVSELLARIDAQHRVLLDELRLLREDVQHLARRVLANDDRDELKRMLPAIEAQLGSQVWTAADLFAAALAPDAQALQQRVAHYASETGGLRSLGHMLDRCTGAVSSGRRLVRVGVGRDGVTYMVERVSGPSKPAPSLALARSAGQSRRQHHSDP
jgi:hypothetical protein